MALSITIDGDKRIIDKLNKIDLFVRNPKKPLSEIGDLLIEEYDKNFETEGRRLNKPWKQLKQATIEQKMKMGYAGAGILQRTKKLRRGFEMQVKRFMVRVFNPVEYFKYHQLGTKHLPVRQMIGTTENIKQDIIEILRRGLSRALK